MGTQSQRGGELRPFKVLMLTVTSRRLFGTILVLFSLLSSGVSQLQSGGFISINCGGDSLKDKVTQLQWENDTSFLDSADQLIKEGVAVRATVRLSESRATSRDNAEQLKTAMVFIPQTASSSPSKYCYNFDVSVSNKNSTNYLIRAMFPSRNLRPTVGQASLTKYSTRFYFTVDSTFISTIELKDSEPQTVELFVTSLDDNIHICFVPLEDKSSMPALSSLELRHLPNNLFPMISNTDSNSETNRNVMQIKYFMTVARLNFGVNDSSPALRFPDDMFDRLWYGAPIAENNISSKTDPSLRSSFIQGGFSSSDVFQIPPGVLTSAWEGSQDDSNISFSIDISAAQSIRPLQSFSVSLSFSEIDPGRNNSDWRRVDVFNGDYNEDPAEFVSAGWFATDLDVPIILFSSPYAFYANFSVFQVRRSENSTLPAMINSFDLYGGFEAETQRTKSSDASTIQDFSNGFGKYFDTAGDPCYPVPWNWLVCSLEVPPRITQMNITSKGVNAKLPAAFRSLDRLTVLDLSNNTFYGTLPPSLVDIPTLRVLDIADNNLSGDLPSFPEKSIRNLQTISLRNNNFTGNLSSLVQALDAPVDRLDLSANNFNGPIPEEILNLTNLEYLNLSFNHLWGSLDIKLLEITQLQTLSLQNNTLQGKVPDMWNSSASKLRTIDLNHNTFTVLDLTAWGENLLGNENSRSAGRYYRSQQQQVSLLDNNISKVILPSQDKINQLSFQSQSRLEGSTGFILLGGNPYCDNYDKASLAARYLCRYNPNESFAADDKDPSKRTLIIGLAVTGVMVFLLSAVLIIVLGRMLKRMKDLHQIQEALAKEDVRPPFFKYEELKAATKDFSQDRELGKGAFGAVYRAELADQSILAVKLLFPTQQNVADFLKEMVLITGIKHRHLIQLKGCCIRDKKRMMVYEYAENGNLAQALWGNKSTVLTWAQRLRICVGIAKGLSYLHEELQPKIIHRDIKPQNILMDKDWNAKIADFGLARPMDEDSTKLLEATSIGGTLGYFSPEYATQGLLTEKLDVYSYGVLVLEIVSGRRCIDASFPPEEIYLKNWATKLYKEGRVAKVAENFILTSVPEEEIESVLKTALLCLQEDHEKRPSMSQVVHMLTGDVTDVAVDVVGELKDERLLYASLFDEQTITVYDGKLEQDSRALLSSTSTTNPQGFIDLSVTHAR